MCVILGVCGAADAPTDCAGIGGERLGVTRAGWLAGGGVAVQGSINIAFHPFSKLEICCAGAKGCSDVM